MAERIDPGTAARLRAVLDEGVVALQRDGLSRILPARFGVVALDEGAEPDERPPASLLDRMAFHVDLSDVALRDADPLASWQDWAAASGVDDVALDPADAVDVALPRGDGAWHRLHARAAFRIARGSDRGRPVRPRPNNRRRSRHGGTAGAGAARDPFPAAEAADTPPEPEPPPETEEPATDPETLPDQPLADVVLDAAKAALPPDLLERLRSMDGGRGLARAAGRAGQFKASKHRGRPVGTRQGEPKGGARLHLLETLKAAAPWQTLRRRSADSQRFEVRRDDFRVVRFRQRIGTTTVFAVDASGSAAMHRLGEAKGAVELLLADCYVRRDQVALLSFRGQGATLLLPPTGSLLRAKRSLAGLPGGGPTPLAAGIEAAMALADTIRRAGRTPVITLLTDARANITRDGSGGRPRAEAEAMEAARAVRASGVATLLVDTSPRPNPFARRLAEEMRAQYVPLPYADASALSRAVRSAGAT